MSNTIKAAAKLGKKMSKAQRDARLWALKIDLFKEVLKEHHKAEKAKPVSERAAFNLAEWSDAINVMAEAQVTEEENNGSN